MITAHLPSGYVLSRVLPKAPMVVPAALIGAIFPDFDMIWFYLVDNRAFHHHHYWVHAPGFWLIIASVGLPALYFTRYFIAGFVFIGAVFMHIFLDGIVGGVMWLWPFDKYLFHMFDVPAVYDNWVWNFLLHWTFLFEAVIWGAALFLFLKDRK